MPDTRTGTATLNSNYRKLAALLLTKMFPYGSEGEHKKSLPVLTIGRSLGTISSRCDDFYSEGSSGQKKFIELGDGMYHAGDDSWGNMDALLNWFEQAFREQVGTKNSVTEALLYINSCVGSVRKEAAIKQHLNEAYNTDSTREADAKFFDEAMGLPEEPAEISITLN